MLDVADVDTKGTRRPCCARRRSCIFLTGPTGAGKTTTGTLWATTRPTPTRFFDLDAVHGAIAAADRVRGFLEVNVDTQYVLAANVMVSLSSASIEAGADCVMTAGWVPPSGSTDPYAPTWDLIKAIDPLVVVLLPSLDACLARDAADRTRRGDAVARREVVEFWHPRFARWVDEPNAVVIDTTELSLDQTVLELERLVVQRAS